MEFYEGAGSQYWTEADQAEELLLTQTDARLLAATYRAVEKVQGEARALQTGPHYSLSLQRSSSEFIFSSGVLQTPALVLCVGEELFQLAALAKAYLEMRESGSLSDVQINEFLAEVLVSNFFYGRHRQTQKLGKADEKKHWHA